jgi:nudix-type nucleoside diphosphatase (YffH/AdpP family)
MTRHAVRRSSRPLDGRVDVQRQRRIFDGFVKIDEAVLRHRRFDGAWTGPILRVKVERGDSAAAIVSNLDTGRVILVEQFRYPTLQHGGGWLVETVAGIIADGETAEQTVRREVREETGYDPLSLVRIATFYSSPGAASERIFLFWARVRETGRVARVTTDDEDIALREYTPAELWAALDRGDLMDGKTIVAATWLRARLSSTTTSER